jgi:ribosomal protein S18 acetylase RimI-like enzyme
MIHGVKENPNLDFRRAEPSDEISLSKIAEESYIYSRYWFDRNFSAEDCRRFYVDWVSKSIIGSFDDHVIVASSTDGVVGFISCKRMTANVGRIGLIGIRDDMRNRGFGKNLIREAILWAFEKDLRSLEVVTQGRNIPAQRLYQGCGFTSIKTELWYHKWFEKPLEGNLDRTHTHGSVQ